MNDTPVASEGADRAEHQVPALQDLDLVWQAMKPAQLSDKHLAKNRIVSAARNDPAHVSFDMLRTRLLLAMRENGWTRVAISSPTSGCGKSFVAANLAVALARRDSCRTVLMDFDLRTPMLAKLFGVTPEADMQEYLGGHIAPEDFLQRVGHNLALGLVKEPAENPAELLQEAMTSEVLDEVQDVFCPEMMIFDVPAVLEHDDLVAFLPNVDGVIYVVGGGKSKAEEVLEAERLLGGIKPLLGVVLNKAEGVISY